MLKNIVTGEVVHSHKDRPYDIEPNFEEEFEERKLLVYPGAKMFKSRKESGHGTQKNSRNVIRLIAQ